MRALPLAFAAMLLLTPTATALPPTWTPTLVVVAMYVLQQGSCVVEDADWLVDGQACMGWTPALECAVRDAAGDACR